MARLRIRPITLREANAFVEKLHRHHKPVRGHRFSISAVDQDDVLVAVAIAGRPVARLSGHPNEVLEVTRVCSDGTPNACSFLYGAMARIARQMGYRKIQSYTLLDEPGTSLRAAGWTLEAMTEGGAWTHTDGRPRRMDQPQGKKRRWVRYLDADISMKTSDTLSALTVGVTPTR